MNGKMKSVWPFLLLILSLILGICLFLANYVQFAEHWAAQPQNPHRKSNIVIADRNAAIIRNASGGYCGQLPEAFVHWLGDRQGNVPAWAAAAFTKELHTYDPVNGLYRYGSGRFYLQLTLDAGLQRAAYKALDGYAGTVGVLNYRTGEILCAVSSPSFDPEKADTVKESMYVNRFLHGRYTPGSVFKLLTTAAVLENRDMRNWRYTCVGQISYGKDRVTCSRKHGTLDLQQALQYSCNCAYAKLAAELGAEKLREYIDSCGALQAFRFDGLLTAAGKADFSDVSGAKLAWTAIGQHKDLINPCAFLSYVGSIANGGVQVQPYLVKAAGSGYRAVKGQETRSMRKRSADILGAYMRENVVEYYGESGFAGYAVSAKTGTAEVEGKKPNAVLTGFLTDAEYPYAFLIIAEDAGSGKNVCKPILEKILNKMPPA